MDPVIMRINNYSEIKTGSLCKAIDEERADMQIFREKVIRVRKGDFYGSDAVECQWQDRQSCIKGVFINERKSNGDSCRSE